MRCFDRRFLALAGILLPALVTAGGVDRSLLPPSVSRPVDFVSDVQPILSARCYGCHGPRKQESELRFDSRESAMQGGESGPAIIAGKSADSLLIHLVAGAINGKRMPKKGEPLNAEQIGILRAWIDQGANWPESASEHLEDKSKHWAFQPPARPALPAVARTNWTRNPIDLFVLARLEKEKLHPAPDADRITLSRRLSLDLLGLPPTPAEVDAFIADTAPNAYEKLVERLLASPHYGERWGRHWLDIARYADTHGYEKDLPRSIWPYRDWVINALNRDLPFDQFTIVQLAGDLLPKATLDQRVATGFLRNSMINEEGGVDPEEFRIAALVDRVDTLGKAFLGVTINCAQCHTHKYDPITQREYYHFLAFLNDDDEPQMEVPDAGQQAKRADILKEIAVIEDSLLATNKDLSASLATWEQEMRALVRDWTVLDPTAYYGGVGTKFTKLGDHSLLATASSPPISTYSVTVQTPLTNITAFRLEALRDPNLPNYGPGRSANGNFVLTELTVEATPANEPTKTNRVVLKNASADYSQKGFDVAAAIDGTDTNKTGWAVDDGPGRRNRSRVAVFETAETVGFASGTILTFTLKQIHGGEHALGRFRLSATAGVKPVQADPLPKELRAILVNTEFSGAAIPLSPTGGEDARRAGEVTSASPNQHGRAAKPQRTQAQQRALFSAYRITDKNLAEANKKIAGLMDQWPTAPTTLVLESREEPRATHIFKRGDFRRLGDLVTPGIPAVLGAIPTNEPLNRLALAKWLVSTNNPTVARVIVNRVWAQYFGRGLVTTPEDFGTQGEKPSHPELLDWLACEFRQPSVVAQASGLRSLASFQLAVGSDSGNPSAPSTATRMVAAPASQRLAPPPWSLKHLHRLIVNSATYRQSSRITPESWERDQYNALLARGARVRVEAEVIRDIALAASGLLNPKIGGPSVYPPIAEGVLSLGYGAPMAWPTETNSNRFRRGLYTFWKRSVPYPSLLVFDSPNADIACARRMRSNTPLQALTTLNDPAFMESAQALGLRVFKEGGREDRARAEFAFRLCTGRAPTDSELKALLGLYEQQYRRFEHSTATALQVALADPQKIPAEVNLHKVAAWTLVARVILNLDETVTKE